MHSTCLGMGGKLQIRSPNLYETQFDVRAFCSANSWDYSARGSFCRRQEVFVAVVKSLDVNSRQAVAFSSLCRTVPMARGLCEDGAYTCSGVEYGM